MYERLHMYQTLHVIVKLKCLAGCQTDCLHCKSPFTKPIVFNLQTV